jgi:hypothetical protein
MANTLTYDPGTSEVTNTENLSQEEQESLKVGEGLVEQQEQLLAGKYKDAEELERAYVELQKKLGEKGTEDSKEAGDTESSDRETDQQEEEETEEVSPAAELISSATDEYEKSGELTPETMAKFSEMSSKDLVEAYIQMQGDVTEDVDTPAADITDAQVNQVKNFAGGEQAYSNIVNWASQNLDQQSIEAFDSIVNSGSVEAIKLAVSGLKNQYEAANGYEGTLYSGKAPKDGKDVFRSQAELVQAMADPRYDKDPAYRQDIIKKLDRSDNLQF